MNCQLANKCAMNCQLANKCAMNCQQPPRFPRLTGGTVFRVPPVNRGNRTMSWEMRSHHVMVHGWFWMQYSVMSDQLRSPIHNTRWSGRTPIFLLVQWWKWFSVREMSQCSMCIPFLPAPSARGHIPNCRFTRLTGWTHLDVHPVNRVNILPFSKSRLPTGWTVHPVNRVNRA